MTHLDERLDPYFVSIGIEPQSLALTGRKYEGEYNGRLLQADCSRRSRTRYYGPVRARRYHGHRLNITLGTPLQTRLILAPAGTLSAVVGFFNRRSGLVEMADLGPAYDYLAVWAFEPDWAHRLLAQAEAQQIIHHLLPRDDLPDNIALNLQPQQLLYSQRIAVKEITPEQSRDWVTNMENLLLLAENLPAPSRVVRPTWIEAQSKKNPLLVGLGLVGVMFAVIILVGLCCTGFLLGASFLMSQ